MEQLIQMDRGSLHAHGDYHSLYTLTLLQTAISAIDQGPTNKEHDDEY